MLLFPRCTAKQLSWFLILICITGVFNVVYMNHMLTFTNNILDLTNNIINQAHLNLVLTISKTKYVLFWNGYKDMKDQDVKCFAPNDNCIFKVRSKDEDLHLFQNIFVFNDDILNSTVRPRYPSQEQLYIFWSLNPSENAPACLKTNEDFYNWTFTYRLDSTVVWKYFVVEHLNSSEIVAPNKSVAWEISNNSVKPHVRKLLMKKNKPLAWIVSDKMTNKSNHIAYKYMVDLQEQMRAMGLSIDMFNNTNNGNSNLDELVTREYHFVIAFEDFIAEDYVSDKVLRGYNNYAVPVVFGGANYSWFLPPGSYLNAKEMLPFSLAYAIKEAVNNVDLYASFFNWTNTYNISAYPDGSHPFCSLCSALNANKNQSTPTIFGFRQWWNTPAAKKICDENISRNLMSWLLELPS